jgi:hypothetical protein
MTVVSFAAMYCLMYSMVNSFANVYANANNLYMAGLMAMPMVVIELLVMHAMYTDRRRNGLVGGVAIIAGVAFFILIRVQGGVGDRQFVRSMIPHHASAILMCQQAPIRDEEVRKLCGEIVSGQQREVDQMKAILDRLDR